MATARNLEKGSYFMLGNELVQVVRKEVVVFGTHSHSKLKLFVKGIESKGTKSINLAHEDKVEIMDIIRKSGQVLSKSNNMLQVMDAVSYETFDAETDPGLIDEINEGDNVTFIEFNNKRRVLDKR